MVTGTVSDINEELEKVVFSIVSYSGEAKGLAYEALTHSENGDFDGAEQLMSKCDERVLKAHAVQTDLIRNEVDGNPMKVTMIMVHAQDHLMTTLSERELIRRMIKQNLRLQKLEKALGLSD